MLTTGYFLLPEQQSLGLRFVLHWQGYHVHADSPLRRKEEKEKRRNGKMVFTLSSFFTVYPFLPLPFSPANFIEQAVPATPG
jgi:hypothetical protein